MQTPCHPLNCTLALILRSHIGPDVGLQAFNPGMLEAETGGSLCIQGHPDLHNEFQASPGHMVRSVAWTRGWGGWN